MRIQILELPSEVLGEIVHTPFALVIDDHPWSDAEVNEMRPAIRDFCERIGAKDAFLSRSQVEVGI